MTRNTDADRSADLRHAIANLRRTRPDQADNPESWIRPDSPYSLLTRQLAEQSIADLRELRSELRRWALGMTAAVIVAFILSVVTK